jgi:hypothetical protein
MDAPPARPAVTARAAEAAETRRAREAEALRENLRKRKAQARAWADEAAPTPPERSCP